MGYAEWILLGLGEVRQFPNPAREPRILHDLFEAGNLLNPHIPTPSLVTSLDVGLQAYRRLAALIPAYASQRSLTLREIVQPESEGMCLTSMALLI